MAGEFYLIRGVVNREAANGCEGRHDVRALVFGRAQAGSSVSRDNDDRRDQAFPV